MLDHLSNITQPVLGYATAVLSGTGYYLAQHTEAVPPIARGWMELGGTVGLVCGLSYGCITLWKELQKQRTEAQAAVERQRAESALAVERAEQRAADERKSFLAAKDALELEIRTDWKKQNEKLISVLEKIDPDNK